MFVRTLKILMMALIILSAGIAPTGAIIVVRGRDANGTINDSGQNPLPDRFNLARYIGRIGNALAVPISPRHVVAATHAFNGGSSSNPDEGIFVYPDGTSAEIQYNVRRVGVAEDLAVWELVGNTRFNLYAPIYTRRDEAGRPLVTFGNGDFRGAAVVRDGRIRGWRWGGYSTIHRSWGTNDVDGIYTDRNYGDLIYFSFNMRTDAQGNILNPDEGTLTGGDSSGPTFVQDPIDGVYKLAGVNTGIDGYVSETPNGPNLNAAWLDKRGYYDGSTLIEDSQPVPTYSFVTRISSRLNLLRSVGALSNSAANGTVVVPGRANLDGVSVLLKFYPNGSTPGPGSAPLATVNVTLDVQGNFFVPQGVLAPGSYRLAVQPLDFAALGRLYSGNITLASTSPPTLPPLELPSGDINLDGTVDFTDFDLFLNAFGLNWDQPGYDPMADMSWDGTVDFADFEMFLNGFGLNGEP